MVPLGLWNDMRLPSFFSGVFFWPVSVSKRGKVRITFMFLSPQLVISCCFPAPWVDSSFVNSERASQPASDVSCKRRTTFSLPLPLSLLFPSLCVALLLPSCSLSLSLTRSRRSPTGSLALSLSLPPFFFFFPAHCTVQWQPWKAVHLAFLPCCLSLQTKTRLTSIRSAAALAGSLRADEKDGFGTEIGRAKAGEGEEEKRRGWARGWMEKRGGLSAAWWLGNEGMLHEEVTAEEGVEWSCNLGLQLFWAIFRGRKYLTTFWNWKSHKAQTDRWMLVGRQYGKIRENHNWQLEF